MELGKLLSGGFLCLKRQGVRLYGGLLSGVILRDKMGTIFLAGIKKGLHFHVMP
jgi:hypothetical protein